MKSNLTEIVCILDKSKSMRSLTNDTIEGYNSFINSQKQKEGEANVTTVLFNDQYDILYDGVDIKKITELDSNTYRTKGMTALLDALGKTIDNIGIRLSNTKEEDRPSKVIFLIITDGVENASKEYTDEVVREKIKHQKEKYDWEFLFIGANIDSKKIDENIGIGFQGAISQRTSSRHNQGFRALLHRLCGLHNRL